MMKAPKKPETKSLIKKASADIMKMASPAVKAWAKTNKIATSKEIDQMPLVQLDKLYMRYLREKGQ
tara:strand:- start:460 stop:657 length:198 start_codon:yes stop_codon:yes gene_type:complete